MSRRSSLEQNESAPLVEHEEIPSRSCTSDVRHASRPPESRQQQAMICLRLDPVPHGKLTVCRELARRSASPVWSCADPVPPTCSSAHTSLIRATSCANLATRLRNLGLVIGPRSHHIDKPVVVEHLLQTAAAGVVAKERRLADAFATRPLSSRCDTGELPPLVLGECTPNHQVCSLVPRLISTAMSRLATFRGSSIPKTTQNLPSN